MGRNKNRHSKDKMYVTVSEHQQDWGGKKTHAPKTNFIRLPFYCCALSLTPFSNPYCTKEGIIFDLIHIIPYLKKYKRNPATGETLHMRELIKLNFSQNSEGKYHCPVTYKVFNENSYIVAIKKTGNVYSNEAIDSLCRKQNNWKDLLTDEEFSPNDIIILQDPLRPKDVSSFYHMKNPNPPEANHKSKEIKSSKGEGPKHERFTTGMTAASFTSTSFDPHPENELRGLTENEIRQEYYREVIKNKLQGEASLITTHGILKFKLFCDQTPMTCENFLTLCEEGYYNDTPFHRSIPGFVIQGGDPSGTGTGGKNIFGIPYFKDELLPTLRHAKRGILSMANSGPNTNKSQFFVTYRATPHLDNKHTVFGELIDGFATLDVLEGLSTDSEDRFKGTEVKILSTETPKNPFREMKEQVIEMKTKKNEDKEEDWLEIPQPINVPTPKKEGVGKYLGTNKNANLPIGMFAEYDSKKASRTTFDFNNW